jgi:hypothetical protein
LVRCKASAISLARRSLALKDVEEFRVLNGDSRLSGRHIEQQQIDRLHLITRAKSGCDGAEFSVESDLARSCDHGPWMAGQLQREKMIRIVRVRPIENRPRSCGN